MEDSKCYIFVINNELEDYLDIFSLQSQAISFSFLKIDELPNYVLNLDKDLIKERFLFVINKDFLNSNALDLIIKVFSSKMKFYSPYFLYLTTKELSKSEEDIILKGENYFYKLPEKSQINSAKYNFNNYLRFIFQKLLIHERLNYYIVDSFQTIIDSEMINKQKREIEKLNHEITELSKIDFLTNLLNRRAFFEALEAEKKRTVRDNWRLTATTHCVKDCSYDFTANPDGKFLDHYGRFCCVLIDIDFFKKINDNYGHLIGDQVLKKIGEVLNNKSIFRENDIIGRYGGEEFILVLPETNSNNAKIPTNRLREYVKTIDFYDDKGNVFHISISIGLSEFNPNDKTNEDLIQRADQALYVAKQQGRDRVVVYEEIF